MSKSRITFKQLSFSLQLLLVFVLIAAAVGVYYLLTTDAQTIRDQIVPSY